jgi:hypothetical protein
MRQLLQQQTTAAAAPAAAAAAAIAGAAGLHANSADALQTSSSSSSGSQPSSCFLQLASGSDCVLHTRASSEVPPGCIQVDEVQAANLRLCAGEVYKLR